MVPFRLIRAPALCWIPLFGLACAAVPVDAPDASWVDAGEAAIVVTCDDRSLQGSCALPIEVGCESWFEDVTVKAGLDVRCPEAAYGHGAAHADVDGDGDPDLVTGCGEPASTRVLINDGTGHFTRSEDSPGLPGGIAFALVDLDGDGDPDLVAGADRPTVFHNDGRGRFTHGWTASAPPERLDLGITSLLAADLDGDGDLDVVSAGPPPRVHLADVGVARTELPLPVVDWAAFIWTLALVDYDARRPPGLVIGDDRDVVDPGLGPPPRRADSYDRLFTFETGANGLVPEEQTDRLGPKLSRASMGVLSADFDDDGRLDLWFSNIGRRHLLLRQEGSGFIENSLAFGLDATRVPGFSCPSPNDRSCLNSTWSAVRADFDADGWHDLVVSTNGTPSLGFRGKGPGGYVPTAAPFACQKARTLIAEDFDGDGRVDLYLTNIEGHDRLLRNVSTGAHPGRLVRFRGRIPNTAAVGARGVVVRASGHREPFLVGEGGRVLAYDILPLHVADRPGDPAVALEVAWPQGARESFPFDPAAGGPLLVVEGTGTAP